MILNREIIQLLKRYNHIHNYNKSVMKNVYTYTLFYIIRAYSIYIHTYYIDPFRTIIYNVTIYFLGCR